MPFISWSDSFSVYNNFVDEQHKRLIKLVNLLYGLREQGKPMAEQVGALDELIAYTKNHFNTEEVLMQATTYANLAVHQHEHDELLASLALERSRINQSEFDISDDLFLKLRSIVIDHMQTTDKDFGEHLKVFMENHPDAPMPEMQE